MPSPRPTLHAIRPEQARRALRGLIRGWHAAREQGLAAVTADVMNPLAHEFRYAVLAGLASVPRSGSPRTQSFGGLASDDTVQDRLDTARKYHGGPPQVL